MKELIKALLLATTLHVVGGACLMALSPSSLLTTHPDDQNTPVCLVWQGVQNTRGDKLNLITQKSFPTSGSPARALIASPANCVVCVKGQSGPHQKKGVTRVEPKILQGPDKSSNTGQDAFPLKATAQLSKHPFKNGSEETDLQRSGAKLVPVHRPKPVYPEDARRLRQEGVALVRVWLTREARVLRCTLVQTSGFQALDREALRAVSQWHFRVTGGVIETALIPVRFSLKSIDK